MATEPDVEQCADTWEIEWVKERLRSPEIHQAFQEQVERRRRIQRRMWDERESLTEKYPGKWILMGEDGILALGESLEKVIAEIDSRGISRDEIVVEYLDSNPPPMMTPYHLLPKIPPAL